MQRGAPLAPHIPTTRRFGDLDCIVVFRVRGVIAEQSIATSITPVRRLLVFCQGSCLQLSISIHDASFYLGDDK
jgi:hypothetical protein